MKKALIAMSMMGMLLAYGCAQDPAELPSPSQDSAATRAIVAGTISPANQRIVVGGSATPVLLTGPVPSGGTAPYSYQWQSSTNQSTWTNIAGATGRDYRPPMSSYGKIYYRRFAFDSSKPTGQQAYSNAATVVFCPVKPILTKDKDRVLSASDIVTFSVTNTPNPSYGLTYHWNSSPFLWDEEDGPNDTARPAYDFNPEQSSSYWALATYTLSDMGMKCRFIINGVESEWSDYRIVPLY